MPGPFFTSNLGEVSRLEGLYIQEVSPPVALKGVFLGVVAVAGTAVRGPADIAIPITSAQRFVDVFGGRNITGSAGNPDSKLWTFFQKKPFGKVHVVRVQASAATGAQLALMSGAATPAVATVYATSSGSYGNYVSVQVLSASDGTATHCDLKVIREGKAFNYKNLDFSSWASAQASLTSSQLTPAAFVNEPALPVYVVPIAANFARPANLAATYMVSGTDGTVADTDYTTTGRGLNVATNVKEAAVVLAAEYDSSTLKSQALTLAGTAEGNGKVFLVGPDNETVSLASAVTDVASYRSDRLVYCFNHPNMIDPTTVNTGGASTIVTYPKSWMASVLSQIDVDIDPGEADTKPMLNGIFSLTNENYVREDYITMRNAGICGLEKQADGGFQFWSAVTTSLTAGLERITRRRMVDFLEQTFTQLQSQVKKKNTLGNRKRLAGAINKFLAELKGQERVVAAFKVDGDSLNTDANRAQGIEAVLVKVKLISHMLEILLTVDASTNTQV